MARVVVYSMGYRGDVLPFVSVARAMATGGHEVRFVVPREFHPLLSGEPFRCIHSGTDFGPRVLDEHARYVARWGNRLGGVMLPRLYFDRLTIPHLDVLFEVIDAEIESAEVVVSHPWAALVSGPACQRRGVPSVVGDLFPMLVPSKDTAPPGLAGLGRWANRPGWGLIRSPGMNRLASLGALRSFRQRLGLSVDGWNIMDARLSDALTVGLFSRHYQPPVPDWPPSYQVVGFTPWTGPQHEPIPEPVTSFLDAGEPPIVVTFGTSAATANPQAFRRVAEALDDQDTRGLFLTSTEDLAVRVRAEVAAYHGVWAFVPLAPLLDRAVGVVHSGAHGTNATALMAGLPSAIRPSIIDQTWHAKRQEHLGTGVRVRGNDFGQAVDRLLYDQSMRERATALAEKLAAEDGPLAARLRIEEYLAGVS